MNKHSTIRQKLKVLGIFEMENIVPNSPWLRFCAGIFILCCGSALLIHTLAPNGFFK